METWDAVRARRNVRTYTDRPIGSDELDRILEAGWRAPSAKNRQARDFVVVTDRNQLIELSSVWQGAGHVAHSTATIALVVPKPTHPMIAVVDRIDVGQAAVQMAIVAADMGIGSGHAAVGDQDAARRILGFPADHECAFMLALGYPADRPLAPIGRPDRRPIDEVIHRSRW